MISKFPFWLRCLLFLAVFSLFYAPLDILIVNGFASEVPLLEDVIDQQDAFDIAIMGSSHAYSGYDPAIIDEVLVDSHTANLSIAALSFEHISLLLKDMIAEGKQPEILVLEMYSFRQPPNFHTQTVFFNGYSNAWRPDNVAQLISDYPPQEWLYTLFPLVYQHDNWMDTGLLNRNLANFSDKAALTQREIDHTRSLYPNGFRPNPLVISDSEFTQSISAPVDIDLINANVKSFERILAMCAEHEIELVFFIAPYPEGLQADYAAMAEVEETYGITIHNFNQHPEDYKQFQFLDDDHLNHYGAVQSSLDLAAVIAEETGRELASEKKAPYQHLALNDVRIEEGEQEIQVTLVPESPSAAWQIDWQLQNGEEELLIEQTDTSLEFTFPASMMSFPVLRLKITYQQEGLAYPVELVFVLQGSVD